MEEPDAARLPSRLARLLSALFYGTCSFLIVLVNKALLTTYGTEESTVDNKKSQPLEQNLCFAGSINAGQLGPKNQL